MDTTAAAELGLAVVGPGVDGIGFWDHGHAAQVALPEEEDYGHAGGSSWAPPPHRIHPRHSFPPPPPPSEPLQKRVRLNGSSADPSTEDAYPGYDNEEEPGYSNGYAWPYAKSSSVASDPLSSMDYHSGLCPASATSVPQGQILGLNPGKGKGTGSIFFKTKLCSKFKAGSCPYNSNCNFAHGMEELRKPPPGWEEIVAAQEVERASRGSRDCQSQPMFSSQGPAVTPDAQRFHKTRPCKKFYTDEGCPYADRCNFLHDDQASQARNMRESNAISLGPSVNSGSTNAGSGANGSDRSNNWKTKVCNKWETTGHCPFGQKCHFAHGHTDGYAPPSGNTRHTLVANPLQTQRQAVNVALSWKGPLDEISTIYGDWIEDDEWEYMTSSAKKNSVQSDSHTTDTTSREPKKDGGATQGQNARQQNLQQQPKVPFFRGSNGYSNVGKGQKNGFSVVSVDGLSEVHESANEQSFHGEGGVYTDDDWETEL